MSNRITDKDSVRIKILAATGRYTPQELVSHFESKYTKSQIIYHLKKNAPNLKSQLKRETSSGGVKLKDILAKIFPNIKIEPEYHVGEKLRLDFRLGSPYNLGFEFDGIQHSKFTPGLHKDEEEFIRGVDKDQRKEELCKGRGINLVRVDYSEELTEELVKSKIDKVGHGTGYIKDGYETGKEKQKKKQKQFNKVAAERKRKQYQKYKDSESYARNKQKQREYRKQQYQKQKEFARKIKSQRGTVESSEPV